MASKTKLSLLLIFVCISVLCVTSFSRSNFRAKYVNSQDPQQKYQQCKQSCQQQELSQKEQKQCVQSCKEQQQYEQCRQECQQKEQGEEQQQCQEQCEKQSGSNPHHEESEEQQQEEENNPFFFDEDCFRDQFKTNEGFARVLQKFSEKSDLLRLVDDYRLAYLEANPNTFILPKHSDAEAFMLVRKGSGTINLVYQNKRESYVIERGYVIRVPAGAVVYYSNDNKEKLKVVTLFKPISVQSEVEDFFGTGGKDPRSFYRSFSEDIIQASFNTEMKDAERLFKKHSDGEVVKANEEQIKALRDQASSSSHGQGQGQGQGESRKPYNLFNKEPTYSNEYGQLYDVDGNDFKQLQYSDISVSYANISKGGMFAPVYNTDSTRIIFVAKGKGRYELICPHLGRQSHESQSHEERGEEERYKRVSANLRRGTANVVLAGHPFSIVASEKQNLHLVIFGINAKNNQRVFLAGKQNWMKNLDRAAKQLSFSTPAREVDQLLEKQDLAHFLPGPSLRQQGGRQARLASILGFNGF